MPRERGNNQALLLQVPQRRVYRLLADIQNPQQRVDAQAGILADKCRMRW